MDKPLLGERFREIGLLGTNAGSSPHVRGTLLPLVSQCRNLRFIPACAGNAT